MLIAISLSEFREQAPAIYRRLIESGGPLYVEMDGRAVMEIRKFQQGPTITHDPVRGVVLNDGDIVSPLEPDGYEPFE
ncbi:hypothetical protein [Duganella vulcania]|uniref:Uncharacterized protein n=1 Tax=Duganella vulcania TaxID=2692166 RepID=A0A845GLR4_9BURK|nr:hypothetical protein [Duganella vulcania]MYM91355.1 hypothetical protein [Duganella vulcania]MYM94400.1 hypothetical protein [Duganella vulcania]